MNKIIGSFLGLCICILFSVSVGFGQCGADGTQPCNSQSKTKNKTAKTETKTVPKSKSVKPKSQPTSVAKKTKTSPKSSIRRYGGLGVETPSIETSIGNLITELKNDPSGKGYIICHGTDESITKQIDFIRRAVTRKNYSLSKITIVRGENRQSGCQVWVVPEGAEPPRL